MEQLRVKFLGFFLIIFNELIVFKVIIEKMLSRLLEILNPLQLKFNKMRILT